jgi:2-amino-4-hydroxy-6-hydroxymethyldihydropteridine diphosphokinase
MTQAVLGLGGNLGDRRAFLAKAVAAISARRGITLMAVSALYETAPWGKTDQPAFYNAAVKIDTHLAPRGLLDAILAIEAGLGRRREERWGPRVVDIDILLYGAAEIDEPGLRVPHPRLAERAFALKPLLDVAPEAKLFDRPARDCLDRLDQTGISEVAPPGWEKREN